MCYTDLMVRRPVCVILVGYAIMVVISAIVAYFGWLVPNKPHDRDYLVWGDEYVTNFDKLKLA